MANEGLPFREGRREVEKEALPGGFEQRQIYGPLEREPRCPLGGAQGGLEGGRQACSARPTSLRLQEDMDIGRTSPRTRASHLALGQSTLRCNEPHSE